MQPERKRGAAVAVLAAAALAAPLVLREFHLHLLTEILILALFATAFNLLFGYTGLLSFGQGAYFAVGAYVTAFILKGTGLPLLLAILAGGLAATLVAVVLGYLCVRRDEIYFAMVTLAFGQIIFVALWRWRDVTGGSDGMGGIPRPALGLGPWAVDLAATGAFYYFTLAVVAASLYALWRIIQSPLGLALRAMRDNPSRVDYLGLSMRRYRLASFTVSAFFAGVAGGLFAPFQGTVTPQIANWLMSAEPVLMSLLGGPAVFWGPTLGAAFLTLLKDAVGSATEYWPLVVGSTVVLLVLFLPGGVGGVIVQGLLRRSIPTDGGTAGEVAPAQLARPEEVGQ